MKKKIRGNLNIVMGDSEIRVVHEDSELYSWNWSPSLPSRATPT